MSISQQTGYGRHARPDDEPAGVAPSLPAQREPAIRPRTVEEYVAQAAGPQEPAFGEWPYGPRRPEQPAEPVGPNPYLPCDESAPEVTLAPGGWPGTLALLAGVTGVGLAMFPIIAIAVWPLTILGLVLGVMGLRRIRAGSARNTVAAVAGIVLSVTGLALCAVWLSLYAVAGVGSTEPAALSPLSVEAFR